MAGVGVVAVLQTICAYVLWNHPNSVAIPPARLSVVVISQFVIGLIVGLHLHMKRPAMIRHFLLYIFLYACSLFLLYGLGPPVAGVNLPPWRPGKEAFITVVLLIGFAIINVCYLFRIAKAQCEHGI